ncbi:unnamed protein product [Leuciscus chuanchicus]
MSQQFPCCYNRSSQRVSPHQFRDCETPQLQKQRGKENFLCCANDTSRSGHRTLPMEENVPQIPTSQKLALCDRQLVPEMRWSASQKWKQDTVVCFDGSGTQGKYRSQISEALLLIAKPFLDLFWSFPPTIPVTVLLGTVGGNVDVSLVEGATVCLVDVLTVDGMYGALGAGCEESSVNL